MNMYFWAFLAAVLIGLALYDLLKWGFRTLRRKAIQALRNADNMIERSKDVLDR